MTDSLQVFRAMATAMLLFATVVEGGYRLTIDLLAPLEWWRSHAGRAAGLVEADPWRQALHRWIHHRGLAADGIGLI